MKHKELEVLQYVNTIAKTNLRLAEDQYSSYDCEDDNYIAEIKVRDKYYKDKLIEADKWLRCCALAQEKNKQFLYIVRDERGTFVFNLSKHAQAFADLETNLYFCPKTTEFGNTEKIEKKVMLLPESYAVII